MDTRDISFNGIRSDIQQYLSEQDTFKDYNFEAPGISTLIDALAYTTHYLVRYANFSINECFLDSAQLRHNVVSQAKQIGYFPYQWKTAKAKIILKYKPQNASEWQDADLSQVKIPAGTMFQGENEEGETFVFRTVEQAGFKLDERKSWYAELTIVEGTFTEDVYTQDEMYISRYYLMNEKADLDFIEVRVFESESDKEGELWRRAESLVDFGPDSPLYYIQEAFNDKIEIYFGDGRISKMPMPYSVIKVKYLITSGPKANNIGEFVLYSSIGSYSQSDFEVIVPEMVDNETKRRVKCVSYGGADREPIESIKLNAPMYWQAQDRAVTIQDYSALLLAKFGGWLKSVIAWGGETAVPPRYGEVIICGLGKYADILSPVQKNEIMEYLEAKNLPDIDVVIVDPDPVDVALKIVVDWWKYKTTKSETDIRNEIERRAYAFFEQYLSAFNVKLRYSNLLMNLTAASEAIDNLIATFTLTKMITPDWKHTKTYNINFLNPITPGSVVVGPWTTIGTRLSCWDVPELDASGKTKQHGILYISRSTTYSVTKEPVGTVDYDSGEVILSSYKFDDGVVNAVPVSAVPNVLNIGTSSTGIFRLKSVTIDMEERS